MNLEPLNDRILVKVDDPETKIGNIQLPDSEQKPKNTGVVVAVGPGKVNAVGVRVPLQIRVGDHVMFKPYPVEVIADTEGGKLMMSEDNVIAKINKTPKPLPGESTWEADSKGGEATDAPKKEKGVVQEQAPLPGNHPLAQRSDMDESLARYADRMGQK